MRSCIKEIAQTRIRYDYQRITAFLGREGWIVNRKRVRYSTAVDRCKFARDPTLHR